MHTSHVTRTESSLPQQMMFGRSACTRSLSSTGRSTRAHAHFLIVIRKGDKPRENTDGKSGGGSLIE
jgi:hypothetical protein